ncbi:MAG: hypothetical protein ABW221_01680 [Vicinamibacteria bacterium]
MPNERFQISKGQWRREDKAAFGRGKKAPIVPLNVPITYGADFTSAGNREHVVTIFDTVSGTLANQDGIQVGTQSVQGTRGTVSVTFTPLAVVGVHELAVYVDGRLETEADIEVSEA